jgi:hypothetical protein
VPTARRRHLITESDDVARALDDAAKRWPADRHSRARLLVRLVVEGHRALAEHRGREVAARRDAVAGTAGALTGVYGQEYLRQLREDWPA